MKKSKIDVYTIIGIANFYALIIMILLLVFKVEMTMPTIGLFLKTTYLVALIGIFLPFLINKRPPTKRNLFINIIYLVIDTFLIIVFTLMNSIG